jgi:hypothetical protein
METNQPTPPRSLKRTHSKIDAEAGQSNTTDQPLVASPDVEPSGVYVVHGHPTPQDEHIDKEPTEEEQLQAMKTAKLVCVVTNPPCYLLTMTGCPQSQEPEASR